MPAVDIGREGRPIGGELSNPKFSNFRFVRVARRSVEKAAELGVGSLSLEEDVAAQAVAHREDEEEARTGYWDSKEEKYVDEEEAEEPGLDRSELAEVKKQSRVFDPGVV